MPGVILVTGFGPFPGVPRNPTDLLARAVDGATVAGFRVVGRVLPVEYGSGPDEAIALATSIGATHVLGTGVASGRAGASWELRGAWCADGPADAAGATDPLLVGPVELASTFARDRAATFGARPSIDAGGYVCNAFLYRVAQALRVPVGFLHVPAEGYPAHRLLTALASVLSGGG